MNKIEWCGLNDGSGIDNSEPKRLKFYKTKFRFSISICCQAQNVFLTLKFNFESEKWERAPKNEIDYVNEWRTYECFVTLHKNHFPL